MPGLREGFYIKEDQATTFKDCVFSNDAGHPIIYPGKIWIDTPLGSGFADVTPTIVMVVAIEEEKKLDDLEQRMKEFQEELRSGTEAMISLLRK